MNAKIISIFVIALFISLAYAQDQSVLSTISSDMLNGVKAARDTIFGDINLPDSFKSKLQELKRTPIAQSIATAKNIAQAADPLLKRADELEKETLGTTQAAPATENIFEGLGDINEI